MKNGRYRPDEEVTLYLQIAHDGSGLWACANTAETARVEAWANKLDQYDEPPPGLDREAWLGKTSTVMVSGRWSCVQDILNALDYDAPRFGEDGMPK